MRIKVFLIISAPALLGLAITACQPVSEGFEGGYRVNQTCLNSDQAQILITPTRYESGRTVCALNLESQSNVSPVSWTFRLGRCTLDGEPHSAPGEGKRLVLTRQAESEYSLSSEIQNAPVPLFKCPK